MTEPVRPRADLHSDEVARIEPDERATSSPAVGAYVLARLRSAHFDRALAVGSWAHPGTAMWVHARRIVSIQEREAIARTLLRAVRRAMDPTPSSSISAVVPVHRAANIAVAEATIDAITLRLHSQRPISPRGMARLRLVLSDGGRD
jgi:hypothetical protein